MTRLTAAWAAIFMSGGLAVAGLGAGTARVDDDCQPAAFVNHVCWGPNHWCPGDSLFHLTQNHVYNPVTYAVNDCPPPVATLETVHVATARDSDVVGRLAVGSDE